MLQRVARLVLPFVLLISVFLYLRGHNLPGGGFIAGLVLAIGLVLMQVGHGQVWVRERSPLLGDDFRAWIGWGLALAGLLALASLAVGLLLAVVLPSPRMRAQAARAEAAAAARHRHHRHRRHRSQRAAGLSQAQHLACRAQRLGRGRAGATPIAGVVAARTRLRQALCPRDHPGRPRLRFRLPPPEAGPVIAASVRSPFVPTATESMGGGNEMR